MSEGDCRKFASLFKEFKEEAKVNPLFRVWDTDNVCRVMDLGLCTYDDIHKLRRCYLASKEDPSVFVDPAPPSELELKQKKENAMRQLQLYVDYTGFSLHSLGSLIWSIKDETRTH